MLTGGVSACELEYMAGGRSNKRGQLTPLSLLRMMLFAYNVTQGTDKHQAVRGILPPGLLEKLVACQPSEEARPLPGRTPLFLPK